MWEVIVRGDTNVVIILLHSNHPRDIIECDGFQAEIGIIGNFADFLDEGVEVGGLLAVDGRDKVCRGEVVLVGRGTAALKELKGIWLAWK